MWWDRLLYALVISFPPFLNRRRHGPHLAMLPLNTKQPLLSTDAPCSIPSPRKYVAPKALPPTATGISGPNSSKTPLKKRNRRSQFHSLLLSVFPLPPPLVVGGGACHGGTWSRRGHRVLWTKKYNNNTTTTTPTMMPEEEATKPCSASVNSCFMPNKG